MNIAFTLWHLSRMAQSAKAGWFWVDYDHNGAKGSFLAHPDKPCPSKFCHDWPRPHVHRPTPEQRARMQHYIDDYERLSVAYEREQQQRRLAARIAQSEIEDLNMMMYRESIEECERIYAREDTRSLPDIAMFLERMTRQQRDVWELNHLYRLEDPRVEIGTEVTHDAEGNDLYFTQAASDLFRDASSGETA